MELLCQYLGCKNNEETLALSIQGEFINQELTSWIILGTIFQSYDSSSQRVLNQPRAGSSWTLPQEEGWLQGLYDRSSALGQLGRQVFLFSGSTSPALCSPCYLAQLSRGLLFLHYPVLKKSLLLVSQKGKRNLSRGRWHYPIFLNIFTKNLITCVFTPKLCVTGELLSGIFPVLWQCKEEQEKAFTHFKNLKSETHQFCSYFILYCNSYGHTWVWQSCKSYYRMRDQKL